MYTYVYICMYTYIMYKDISHLWDPLLTNYAGRFSFSDTYNIIVMWLNSSLFSLVI